MSCSNHRCERHSIYQSFLPNTEARCLVQFRHLDIFAIHGAVKSMRHIPLLTSKNLANGRKSTPVHYRKVDNTCTIPIILLPPLPSLLPRLPGLRKQLDKSENLKVREFCTAKFPADDVHDDHQAAFNNAGRGTRCLQSSIHPRGGGVLLFLVSISCLHAVDFVALDILLLANKANTCRS
jgi:hypothetical protein